MYTGTTRPLSAVVATVAAAAGIVPEQPASVAAKAKVVIIRAVEVFMGKASVLIRYAHDVAISGVSSGAGENRHIRSWGSGREQSVVGFIIRATIHIGQPHLQVAGVKLLGAQHHWSPVEIPSACARIFEKLPEVTRFVGAHVEQLVQG